MFRNEYADKVLNARLHHLVSMLFYGARHPVLREALDDMGISRAEFLKYRIYNSAEVEVTSRMMFMDPTSELFLMTLQRLMPNKKRVLSAHIPRNQVELYDRGFTVLFQISNRLPDSYLKSFVKALNSRTIVLNVINTAIEEGGDDGDDQDEDYVRPEFCDDMFRVQVEAFKKHPRTFEENDHYEQIDFVRAAMCMWVRPMHATNAASILKAMLRSRHAFTEESRVCMLNALSADGPESYAHQVEEHTRLEDGNADVSTTTARTNYDLHAFDVQLAECRRKLSRPSMAWLKIRPRVRVLAFVSLMIKEAAMRVYQPGTDEYVKMAKRFKAGPSAYSHLV